MRVMEKVKDGYTLQSRRNWPEIVKETMKACFQKEDKKRPTFQSIQKAFQNVTKDLKRFK